MGGRPGYRWIPPTRELRLLLFLTVAGLLVGGVAPALNLASPGFLHAQNLIDVLVNASPYIIAAAGMTLVIVGGGIDISIGSLLGACAIAAGLTARQHGVAAALVAPLALGLAVGALNGALITWLRIPALVATLGMLSVIRGITVYLTGGNEVRELPAGFRQFSLGTLFSLPYPLWLAALVVAATFLFMARMKVGRDLYAVGGNETAARLSTIPVARRRLFTHAACGFCVGLAALVQASRFSSIQITTGVGFELVVITAVVLGGTSILGGSGNTLGSALGAIALQVIPNALTFLGVRVHWKEAAVGGVVLLAVLSSASAKR